MPTSTFCSGSVILSTAALHACIISFPAMPNDSTLVNVLERSVEISEDMSQFHVVLLSVVQMLHISERVIGLFIGVLALGSFSIISLPFSASIKIGEGRGGLLRVKPSPMRTQIPMMISTI